MTLDEEIEEQEAHFNQIAVALSDFIGYHKDAHDLFWRMYHDYHDMKLKYRDGLQVLNKEYMFHINNYKQDCSKKEHLNNPENKE
jgi:hypothetical protein